MRGKIVNGVCVIAAAILMVSFGMGLKFTSEKEISKLEPPASEGVATDAAVKEDIKEDAPINKTESENKPEQKVEKIPKKKSFTDAPEGYFEDALFIGDSRTVGLAEYGNVMGADFFATTGMSVYNIYNEYCNVADFGKTDFLTLITNKQYKKIYVMLGINELGYGRDATAAKYGELLKNIKSNQPDSIIFIEANLHVAKERSDADNIFNNDRIDAYNRTISEFADNESVFYIDVNPLFDDGEGNLADKYTSDHSHILARYYEDWRIWLESKAIV